MDNKPLVSIITVAYNADPFIEKTIQSVLSQTYSPIEYIIIDGGSTDNTVNIIKGYSNRIAYWRSEKDNGISDAFNKGLSKATGDIIGIINADDWYEKDAVEKVVAKIKDADVVYSDMQLWKNDEKDFVMKGDHQFLTKEMTVSHPSVFIRKECYTQFGLFDTQYELAMDYDLMLRLKINDRRFLYIPETLANMRWAGLSDKKWLTGCKETLMIKNKYIPRKKINHLLYFCKHVLAIAISKTLRKTKTDFLIKPYRSRFAKVKKIY